MTDAVSSFFFLFRSAARAGIALSPITAYATYEFWAAFERLPLLCMGQFILMLSFATVMNYYWFYKITKGLIKALRKTFGAGASEKKRA